MPHLFKHLLLVIFQSLSFFVSLKEMELYRIVSAKRTLAIPDHAWCILKTRWSFGEKYFPHHGPISQSQIK